MHIHIQEITAAQTLPIRHQVLWPHKPIAYCLVAGDESAQHWGAFHADKLVSVGSLYINNQQARLRKFATLTDFQGQGIGSQMMTQMLATLSSQAVHYFWLDARETAIPFYQRFGLNCEGERFYKEDIAYVKMSKHLNNA